MKFALPIFLFFILFGCDNTGKWFKTDKATKTMKEADEYCLKLHSQHDSPIHQGIYYDECMEREGFAFKKDTTEVFECRHQCKAQFRRIDELDKQFECLDKCDLLRQ